MFMLCAAFLKPQHCSVCVLTLKHKLLHLDLVELVGADDDAVAGQMNAAAGLQSFNLL